MLCLFFAEKPVTFETTEAADFLRASRCVKELKENNKLICLSETQQYFIYLIGYQFRSLDHIQATHT